MALNYDTMKTLMNEVMKEMKDEIIKTIDTNCQALDQKINKNTEEVIKIQVNQEVLDEKVNRNTNKIDDNTEKINDFDLRLKQIEKNRLVDQNKLIEIELEMDQDKTIFGNNGKIDDLNKEITILKETNKNTKEKLILMQ